MIKFESLGMIDRVVVNPVLTNSSAVKNHSFLTKNGELYLVSNTIVGDDSYKEDVTIPANEYINGYLVRSLDGQKLVVDEKHIKYGDGQTYASSITAGTTLFKVNGSDELVITAEAPASGVYFKATEKCRLTEKAVKLLVCVVDKDTVSNG